MSKVLGLALIILMGLWGISSGSNGQSAAPPVPQPVPSMAPLHDSYDTLEASLDALEVWTAQETAAH